MRTLVQAASPVACMLALGLWLGGQSASPAAELFKKLEFSADIVSRDAAGTPGAGARLYVANRKVRIETPTESTGFFLIDADAGTAFFVRPTAHVFMDAKQSTPLIQIFVPLDRNDPCRHWRAAAIAAGVPGAGGAWICERRDSRHGKSGDIEYRVSAPPGNVSERWIDPELDFPVKLRAADGATLTLEHLRVAAQPASLFAIPADYHKTDPQSLIERIKHSDVWAGQRPP
jgi:hypothetical protein